MNNEDDERRDCENKCKSSESQGWLERGRERAGRRCGCEAVEKRGLFDVFVVVI
jgi:hypothetical protein